MQDDQTFFQEDEELKVAREQSLEGEPTQPSIDGYSLSERLGEGSFGEVWCGIQESTGQPVAIKLLLRGGLDWTSFYREVERLREVAEHPHVVTLLDADFEHSPPFIVMPYLGGGSLAEIDIPEPSKAAEWFRQLADALRYTHDRGVLHCDIKPNNVLIDDEGRVRLADFGQAVRSEEREGRYGTLGFMAPEQTEPGASPSTRWDIYGLGATMYRLLTGRLPRVTPEDLQSWSSLGSAKIEAYAAKIRSTELVWIQALNPQVDDDLAFTIMRCLTPDLTRRTESASEILADLERRARGYPLNSARPWKVSYWALRWLRRNKAIISVMILTAILLVTPLIYLSSGRLPPPFERGVSAAPEWKREKAGKLRQLDFQWWALFRQVPEVNTVTGNPSVERAGLWVRASLSNGEPFDPEVAETLYHENLAAVEIMREAAANGENLKLTAEGNPPSELGLSVLATVVCQVLAERGALDEALNLSLDRLAIGHRAFRTSPPGSMTREQYLWDILIPLQIAQQRRLESVSSKALWDAKGRLEKISLTWVTPEQVLADRQALVNQMLESNQRQAILGLFQLEMELLSSRRFEDLRMLQLESRRDSDQITKALHPWESDALKAYVAKVDREEPKYLQEVAFSRAMLDGLRFSVALELWSREHESLPNKLEELAPAYISSLPTDPLRPGENSPAYQWSGDRVWQENHWPLPWGSSARVFPLTPARFIPGSARAASPISPTP